MVYKMESGFAVSYKDSRLLPSQSSDRVVHNKR